MRNLVYVKIKRQLGQLSIVEKVVTKDLEGRISWGERSSSKALSVLQGQNVVRIAFDGFNSLPLFWGETDEGAIIVSNRHNIVSEAVKVSAIDPIGFWELYLFESPLLSRTLFKGVSVSQSGHELVIDQHGCRLNRRFNFAFGKQACSKNIVDKAHELLSNKLSQTYENPVVPISGGLDSRLILSYMKDRISGNTQFVTYGFSPKILENIYAKEILQRYNLTDYSHQFHQIESQGYLDIGLHGAKLTGAFAGIQNSHLLGYAQKSHSIGAPCILGMFADAIFGYGVSQQITDWRTCSYAKKVKNFHAKGILTDGVVEQILSDLKLLYDDWVNGSDISSFDEYLYVRERNGKFHSFLMSALQDYWDVDAPLNDPDLIKFFMSLPNDVRQGKAIVSEVLKKFFPELRQVGDVSSSFRHGNGRIFHRLSSLTNQILSRKFGMLPVVPIYTDTERHDYCFMKYYKGEYQLAIDQMKGYLNLNQRTVAYLAKLNSGMHGFQFISNAKVIGSVLTTDDK